MAGNVLITWQPPVALANGDPIPPGDAVSRYVVELAVVDLDGNPGPYSQLNLATPTSTQATASNLPGGDYIVRVTPYDNQRVSLAGVPATARFSVILPALGSVQNLVVEVS